MSAASGGSWPVAASPNGMPATGCPRCRYRGFAALFAAGDRLYGTTERRFHLVECNRCGLMRLEPQPPAEELRQFYPDTYWWEPDASAVSWLEGLYRRLVLSDHVRFVATGAGERGAVLDVGCGGGSFAGELRRRGALAVGLDTSARAAAVAWRENAVPAVAAALPDAPFAPESFSAITMFHVLEHLAEPQIALQAAHRLLARDGRLYAQVPNASCWQFLVLGERWSGIDVPRHLIHFRAEDLEELLTSCGFRVTRRKFFSLRDNPAGLATSLLPQWEPMSRRVRRRRESTVGRLARNLVYLAVVAAALPFAALEAAAGAGSTILVEAVKQ